ncbi:MAG: hypothetical protein DLM50_00310 [Candidatus Meridianibacter frigidus]|nr:MAG: hypothetical protein DLM50_00310 [Candidatus Eremiobacteraeota bacterium]
MIGPVSEFEKGVLLGLLVGEAHFGGDARQPQITLRMHVRHEPLLRWLHALIIGSRLYGPYHHAQRHYYQLMVRNPALRNMLVPLLDSLEWRSIDPHTYERYAQMKLRYGLLLA